MVCVRDLLNDGNLPRLEAQILLRHVLQVPRVWLVTHDRDPLDSRVVQQFRALEAQRLAGHPMAYLMGEREFFGHDFQVCPSVLIPRPETELLVETAIEFLQPLEAGRPRVVDLGSGSGAIAVSIALACPFASVAATDVSLAALDVAQENARRLGAPVEFFAGSWYDALLGQEPFDLIVSNPPYIACADHHLAQGDLRFEPRNALTDGGNGLQALAAIVNGARTWLRAGGALWMEHGWDQAHAVRALLHQAGFSKVESRRDLAGIERISGGYL